MMKTCEWCGHKAKTLATYRVLPDVFMDVCWQCRQDLRSTEPEGMTPLPPRLPVGHRDLRGTLRRMERQMIDEALQKTEGNKNQAAKLLGLNRTTLVMKVRKMEEEAKG